MSDPPARNTIWREGFNNPVNYDDNGLNCGGLSVSCFAPFSVICHMLYVICHMSHVTVYTTINFKLGSLYALD